jgi:hypothetical protein
VATTGVDNTMRADMEFSRYLDFLVFQQYRRFPVIENRDNCGGNSSPQSGAKEFCKADESAEGDLLENSRSCELAY